MIWPVYVLVVSLALSLQASLVKVEPLKPTPFTSNLFLDFHTNHSVLSRNTPLMFQLKSFPLGVKTYSEELIGMRQNPYGTSVLILFNGQERIYLQKLDCNPLIKHAQSYEKHFQKFLTTKIARGLKEGKNAITAVPLNSFGESTKFAEQIQTRVVDYGKRAPRDAVLETKLSQPHVLYNEPKGKFLKGESLLLDFVVLNTVLSKKGNRVVLKIDGEQVAIIEQNVPHKISHLPRGNHLIKIVLIDKNGHPLEEPFGNQESQIVIE